MKAVLSIAFQQSLDATEVREAGKVLDEVISEHDFPEGMRGRAL